MNPGLRLALNQVMIDLHKLEEKVALKGFTKLVEPEFGHVKKAIERAVEVAQK